jgi:transcriptional regulator with XRE-family HTH domain
MLYQLDSYKDVLRSALLARRDQLGRTYTYQSLATACRVQKTYLSRVFNGDAHLSDDQLFLACEFLSLGDDERRYATLLHQRDRSVVQKKRQRLGREIEAMRARYLKTEGHLAVPPVVTGGHDESVYFLSPHYQLVHMFLMVPRFAQDPARLRQQLGLSEKELADVVTALARLGLVRFEGGRYEVLKPALHLPSDSPLYRSYRALTRLKAMARVDRLEPDAAYNFSVVFTADEPTRRHIQARFLEFLKEVEEAVRAAPSDDVYQMHFDLFPWTR